MTTTTKISFKKFYTLIGVLAAHTRQDSGEVKRTWVMQASGRQTDSVSTLRAQFPAQYLRMMEELERTVNRITEKREDEMDALRKRVLRVGCELVRKQMGVVENPINYVKEMIFRQTRGVPFNKVDRETLNGIIFKWNRILKGAKEMVGDRMFGVN